MRYVSLSIFLGGSCNLNCSYCFIDKKNLKKISPDVIKLKKGIDLFLRCSTKDPTINFTGGEPLLYWEILRELIEYIREKKRRIFMVVSTNGTLLDKEMFKFLKKYNVALSVSLDGKKEVNDIYRGSFETVWGNIKDLDRERIKISSVFTPKTINYLVENIKFFVKHGFRQFDFYPEVYGLWSKDQLRNLERVFSQLKLSFNGNSQETKFQFIDRILHKNTENFCCQKLNLASDGNFYLCDKVFSFFDERRKKYMVGDTQKGINEDKREKLLKEAKKEILKETQNKCLKCSWQNYCFCPIGLYLWAKENKKDFEKHFKTFCGISKIYISAFLKICQNQRKKYY